MSGAQTKGVSTLRTAALLAAYVAGSSFVGLLVPSLLVDASLHPESDPRPTVTPLEFYIDVWTASPLASVLFVVGSAAIGAGGWRLARRHSGLSMLVAGVATTFLYVNCIGIAFPEHDDALGTAIATLFTLPGVLFASVAPQFAARRYAAPQQG